MILSSIFTYLIFIAYYYLLFLIKIIVFYSPKSYFLSSNRVQSCAWGYEAVL